MFLSPPPPHFWIRTLWRTVLVPSSSLSFWIWTSWHISHSSQWELASAVNSYSTGYCNRWHCSHTDRLIRVPQLHTGQAIGTGGIAYILTDWFMFHSYTLPTVLHERGYHHNVINIASWPSSNTHTMIKQSGINSGLLSCFILLPPANEVWGKVMFS